MSSRAQRQRLSRPTRLLARLDVPAISRAVVAALRYPGLSIGRPRTVRKILRAAAAVALLALAWSLALLLVWLGWQSGAAP
jgi:hypothetical protein